jgi:hypothetical protein
MTTLNKGHVGWHGTVHVRSGKEFLGKIAVVTVDSIILSRFDRVGDILIAMDAIDAVDFVPRQVTKENINAN